MSYQGLVLPILIGPEGLTGSKNLATVRPTQLLKAHNVTFENGTTQKEPGTALYTASAIDSGAAIMAGHDWWPSTGVQRSIIVNGNGKALRDDGSGTYATTLTTGLNVSSVVPIFVEGGKEAAANNRKLFLFTGKNQVKVLSGDALVMNSITTPPADWAGTSFPKTGVVHEGRLWGFMGHVGYYSTSTDHENFTAATSGSISVYPGEGEEIVCAFVMGPYIVVGKQPSGWYLIDTSDPTVTNWKVQRITAQIGSAGPAAFIPVEGDTIVVDVSGEMFALSSVTQTTTDVRPQSITQAARFSPFIRENTAPSQYYKACGIYYPAKRQGWLGIAGAGSTVNTARIKLDFNGDALQFAFSDFVPCESLWLVKDANNVPRPYAGDSQGFVRKLDQSALLYDSGGYQGEFQTPHSDFGHIDAKLASRRKNGQFLEMVFEPQGAWDLNVDVLWDGAYQQTVGFDMGGGSAILGTSTTLTTGNTGFVLGGDQVVTRRKRIVGSGRRLSILGRNNGAGQNFSVAQAYLHCTLGDERE